MCTLFTKGKSRFDLSATLLLAPKRPPKRGWHLAALRYPQDFTLVRRPPFVRSLATTDGEGLLSPCGSLITSSPLWGYGLYF